MEIMNYYHPLHEVFTLEYGWMPIDRLYEKFSNGQNISIAQFDMETISFPYTNNFAVLYNIVRSCTYEFGRHRDSDITFNVQPHCNVLCSLDGGETLEYVTAKEIHKTQQNGYVVKIPNMESLYDMANNKRKIRLNYNIQKRNYRFNNGLTYGLVTQTGAILSRYKGRFVVLQTYVEVEDE